MKLLLLFLFLALPVVAQAQFEFTTNNGTIAITDYSGTGGAVNIPAEINGYPVTSIGEDVFYASGVTSVTIPAGITNIGPQAFLDCTRLTSITVAAGDPDYSSVNGVLFDQTQATLITYPGGLGGGYIIPNNVANIGEEAFEECTSLTSVTIPKSVISIGMAAFGNCAGLTNMTIPTGVTTIGVEAFSYCAGLTNVTIPTSVTTIGSEAFSYTSLKSVTIPNSVTSIGQATFSQCTNLSSVTIPNSVTNLGGGAFSDCYSLTNVTIPNSVTSIGVGAFTDCSNLKNVTIPAGVTNIGQQAFIYCASLKNVTIPASVISIGEQTFVYCNSLTNITVVAGNPDYSSVNGVLFDRAEATLIAYPGGLGGGYTIPNSVTNIGEQAFIDCLGLTSVTIPNTVRTIGDYAFSYCSGLTSAYFLGNAPPNDGTVFYSDLAKAYYLAGTLGWSSTFGSVPTVELNPVRAQSPGVTVGQFGFGIIGPTNTVIVVEACTNLANPVWLPVATNTLGNTGVGIFSDPKTRSYGARFYRLISP